MGYAYNPSGEWTSTHQMSVNGKFDGITRKDLIECASLNNIKEADTIIDSIVDCVADWPKIARECKVPDGMIKAISPNFVTL